MKHKEKKVGGEGTEDRILKLWDTIKKIDNREEVF